MGIRIHILVDMCVTISTLKFVYKFRNNFIMMMRKCKENYHTDILTKFEPQNRQAATYTAGDVGKWLTSCQFAYKIHTQMQILTRTQKQPVFFFFVIHF